MHQKLCLICGSRVKSQGYHSTKGWDVCSKRCLIEHYGIVEGLALMYRVAKGTDKEVKLYGSIPVSSLIQTEETAVEQYQFVESLTSEVTSQVSNNDFLTLTSTSNIPIPTASSVPSSETVSTSSTTISNTETVVDYLGASLSEEETKSFIEIFSNLPKPSSQSVSVDNSTIKELKTTTSSSNDFITL